MFIAFTIAASATSVGDGVGKGLIVARISPTDAPEE